ASARAAAVPSRARAADRDAGDDRRRADRRAHAFIRGRLERKGAERAYRTCSPSHRGRPPHAPRRTHPLSLVRGRRAVRNPLLAFGPPPDLVAWTALAAAAPALIFAIRRWMALERFVERRPRALLFSLAIGAALLSAGYVAFYLR